MYHEEYMIDSMKQVISEMLEHIDDEQAVMTIYALVQEYFLEQE